MRNEGAILELLQGWKWNLRQFNLGIPAKRRGVLRASSTRLALLWIRPGTGGGAEQRRGVPESGSEANATRAEPRCTEGRPALPCHAYGAESWCNEGLKTPSDRTGRASSSMTLASRVHYWRASGPAPAVCRPSWSLLEACWVRDLRGILGRFGAVFGASWAILEVPWAGLRASWAAIWPSWGPLGAVLGMSWAHLGHTWGNLGSLGHLAPLRGPFRAVWCQSGGPLGGCELRN